MASLIKRVKLQARKTKKTAVNPTFFVVVPQVFVAALGWQKGDELEAIIIDYEIEPKKKVKGILFFRR